MHSRQGISTAPPQPGLIRVTPHLSACRHRIIGWYHQMFHRSHDLNFTSLGTSGIEPESSGSGSTAFCHWTTFPFATFKKHIGSDFPKRGPLRTKPYDSLTYVWNQMLQFISFKLCRIYNYSSTLFTGPWFYLSPELTEVINPREVLFPGIRLS